MDYTSNSKKSKEKSDPEQEKKPNEKAISGEVITRKKPLGKRFKETLIEADFPGVTRYVFLEVLIPAAKNMLVDSVIKGAERAVYGDRAIQRRNYGSGSYTSYNRPVDRGFRDPRGNTTYRQGQSLPSHSGRVRQDEIILSSREEANVVIERMSDIIDIHEVASMADLKEIIGISTDHIDYKWGWESIRNTTVRQIREGYLLDFPPPIEI